MTTMTLNEVVDKADALTLEEQLWLVARLIEKIRTRYPVSKPRRKWREIRGAALHPLLGEDAQAWVTRTRQESDECRERQWRHNV